MPPGKCSRYTAGPGACASKLGTCTKAVWVQSLAAAFRSQELKGGYAYPSLPGKLSLGKLATSGRRLESLLVAPELGACERLVWSACHTFAEQPGGRLDAVTNTDTINRRRTPRVSSGISLNSLCLICFPCCLLCGGSFSGELTKSFEAREFQIDWPRSPGWQFIGFLFFNRWASRRVPSPFELETDPERFGGGDLELFLA